MLAYLALVALCADITVAFQIRDASAGSSCAGKPSDHDASLGEFIRKHNRSYEPGSKEYAVRRGIFIEQLAKVEQHNCKSARRWTAVASKFTDRTTAELAKQYGYKRHRKSQKSKPSGYTKLTRHHVRDDPLPSEVSYKHLAAMEQSQIVDQGQCGSCWAAASSVVLRAHSELYKEDTKYSMQELVSCTPNPDHCGGTGGCSGATGELAFEYVMKYGLSTEEEFPYEGTDVECPKELGSSSSEVGGATIGMTGWTQLPNNQMEPLQRSLVEKGPSAVSVAADDYWFFYSSGVMDSCSNADPIVNHLVVLIGYGEAEGTKYWEIQNSWGGDWGDNGHMKILRTDDEETYCGMDTEPQDGMACEGEDDPVEVCGHCGILFDAVVPEFGDSKTQASVLQHVSSPKSTGGGTSEH